MARKTGKKTTIDDLAVMINDGFNGQMTYMEKRFNDMEERFDPLEKDVKYIKENLTSAIELEKDVEYIKNTLNIPAIKK
jgi:hypothetical protein